MTLRGSRTVLSVWLFALVAAVVAALVSPVASPAGAAPPEGREPAARGTFPALQVRTVLSNMDIPWDVQQLPGGGLLVTERTSKKLWVKDGSGKHQVSFPNGNIWASGETGLMGLAIDPKFGSNRKFYTCHGRTLAGGRHDIAVVAWRLSANRRSASRVRTLLGGIQTVMGPVLGAAAFHSIKDVIMPLTDFWRFFLGASIIALVLLFPRGLGGAFAMLRGQREVTRT